MMFTWDGFKASCKFMAFFVWTVFCIVFIVHAIFILTGIIGIGIFIFIIAFLLLWLLNSV